MGESLISILQITQALSLFTLLLFSSTEGRNYLLPGDSLSVEESSDILKSPNGVFSCGFDNISQTAFTFSIWFSNSANKTVVWTAKPNRPVHGSRSIIKFSKHRDLVVKDYGGEVVWSTNYKSSYDAYRAELLDSGNFIITDQDNNIIWQSFDNPTDTLLANQSITANNQLVSANISASSERKPLEAEEGYKMISSQFRRFTYKELERATGKFKDVIGMGGSGVVYKGVLKDGRVIAAKMLKDVTQGGEEFQAELSITARIYHMNLVRVWGFCFEGSHRILVYEYVENNSLDKALFGMESDGVLLCWELRYKIALGVAKGLAYLHHECLEWVIHCDVKPENILLDLDYEPKITDFGLAKLLHRGGTNSKMSKIRGTRGYIAPEWASNHPITAKVDVYSYGVLLLELIMGVRVSDWMLDNGDNELRSLFMMLKEKLEDDQPNNWVGNIVDSRLNGQFNHSQAIICVKLAISCLEEERSKRPSMHSVVLVLNSYDLQTNSMKIS
ncbi:hypothetical protein LUZ60_008277 [Juncus effusus]|nr:hypothetical protein LUZ60_008277 [Juncus effusus]